MKLVVLLCLGLSLLLLVAADDSLRAVSTTPDRAVTRPKPKPISLTTAKPSKPTSKPDSGGGGDVSYPTATPAPATGGGTSSSYYLYPACTTVELLTIMNLDSFDVRECTAFSTYDFGSGLLPTAQQKSLLCDAGCYDLINRLEITPVPLCSVVLGGLSMNYIDALYTVFADCAAASPTIVSPVASPVTTSHAATSAVLAVAVAVGVVGIHALV